MSSAMPAYRIPEIENSPSKIQLARISHVHVQHSDLKSFKAFSRDFGLEEVATLGDATYLRGFGRDQYCYVAQQGPENKFLGGAFIAQTEADFDKATKLPGAETQSIEHTPGGGRAVVIPTPGGNYIHVIWGKTDREGPFKPVTPTVVNMGPYNGSLEKKRKGQFQRFKPGPAMVHKLGHYGFVTPSFEAEVAFYTTHFNFAPTDILHQPGNAALDVMVFFHLDLGDDFTDHHTFFLQRASPEKAAAMSAAKVHHSSFEVEDFDTQTLGHEWLAGKGYELVWGVGRHVMGSQIFDYWKDTGGFTVEHYADGDLVNKDSKTKRQEAGLDTLYIWGPPLPENFA